MKWNGKGGGIDLLDLVYGFWEGITKGKWYEPMLS
jgi:hypothetical protein